MSLITQEEMKALVEAPDGVHISLYMPTRVGSDLRDANRIQLRNLVKEATQKLADWGADATPAEIDEMLRPASDLAAHGRFWGPVGGGLAMFFTPEFSRIYRLPLDFQPEVYVGENFHLTPLLPILASNGRFYILALSQDKVRLLQGTHYTVDQVDLHEDIPQSLAEAMQWDDPESHLQWQTGTGVTVESGDRAAIFHGHAISQASEHKTNLLRFFQMIDDGLTDLLGDDVAPLVLAGVDYLLPIYRQANTYEHLVEEEAITGNPEMMSAKELHGLAWEIVEPLFAADEANAADAFKQVQGNGQASSDLADIVTAAHFGRVDTLFTVENVQRWGRFYSDTGAVHIHPEQTPGDVDLLNDAAVQTFLNGGTVYVVPPQRVPADSIVAAVYRY